MRRYPVDLDWLLDRSLDLSRAGFGNIQLMNWRAGYLEIKAQRGFQDEFLNFFERVKLEDVQRALGHCGLLSAGRWLGP
jgi:hypothetical protein